LSDGQGETILRKVREDRLSARVAVCTGMGDLGRWRTVQGLDPEPLPQKPIDVGDVCTAWVGSSSSKPRVTIVGIHPGGVRMFAKRFDGSIRIGLEADSTVTRIGLAAIGSAFEDVC
jgi:hypothetical protein